MSGHLFPVITGSWGFTALGRWSLTCGRWVLRSGIYPRTLGGYVAALTFVAVAAQGQEAVAPEAPPAAAVQAVATTEEQAQSADGTDLNEQDGLSVEPISADNAGLDSTGAGEAAEVSLQDLKKGGVPQAFLFRVALGATYNENLLLSEFSEENDIGLVELLGVTYRSPEGKNSAILFDYEITGTQYQDHSELDGTNQSTAFKAVLNFAKTTLNLNVKYDYLSNVIQAQFADSAAQAQFQSSYANQQATQFTQRQNLNASLTASRDLAPKTVMNATVAFYGNYYDADGLQSSQALYGQGGLGYRITGKTTLGLAGALGFLETDNVPDQRNESVLLTANYDATGKLVLNAQAGPQFNHYDSSAVGGLEYPETTQFVFNIGGTYQFRPKTKLQLSAYSSTNGAAAVAGANAETTQIRMTLTQNIGQRILFEMAGAYEKNTYATAGSSSSDERKDTYFNGALRLSFQPTKKSSIGCFYNYLTNESNAVGASYEGSRFGVQAAVAF